MPPQPSMRYWLDGARSVGRCVCGGALLLLEDMGAWEWAQCERCLQQTGVRPRLAAKAKPEDGGPVRAADTRESWGF